MAEKFTPIQTTNLSNQTSITAAIDSNFQTLSSLLQDVLARSSSINNAPNAMGSALDMNSNQILNLPAPTTVNSPVRLSDINSTLTPTPAILSGSNVYTGNNSFSGTTTLASLLNTGNSIIDGSLAVKTGHPWIDVTAWGTNVGQGNAAVDTAAFQAAIAYSLSTGLQVIFVPAGTYSITTTLTANTAGAPIVIQGGGRSGTELNTGGTDITMFDSSGGGAGFQFRDIFIVGKGVNDTGSFGATQPLIKGGFISTSNCNIWGGAPPLYIENSGDCVFYNTDISLSYSASLLYTIGSGNWYIRFKADQPFPNGDPTNFDTYTSWASTHAYTSGQIATLSSYIIQCTHSGTSGSSPPALKNYDATMTDGSNGLTWQLVGIQDMAGVIVDSNCVQNSFFQLDVTGSYAYGMIINDSLNTGVPQLTTILDSNFGSFQIGLWAIKGSGLNVVNCNFLLEDTNLVGGTFGLKQDTAFAGETILNANTFSSMNYPVYIGGGANTIISDNVIIAANGTLNVPITVANGVQGFIIANNVLGSTSTAVTLGVSNNFYNISNNLVYGTTVQGSTTSTTFVGGNV